MPRATSERRGVAIAERPEKPLPGDAAAAPRRPHICFVALHAWPVLSGDAHIPVIGGAEVQQSLLARLFAANGYRVSMICLDFGQPEPTVVDGITVLKAYRPHAGMPVLRFLYPRLTGLWRTLRAAQADIYYCRSACMEVGIVAEFCRRYARRSVYAGASDMDFVPGEGGQIRFARDRWLYRRGLAQVDRIVAQNEFQRSSCRSNYGREPLVIPSCYMLADKHERSQVDKDRVLWVGTVRAGKRPQLLLDIAARLPHRRFVMVGGPAPNDPALFERIRARAAALGNVELTGFVPLAAVDPWFDRAKVFVNTSIYEGMPNTFLQAWARGVPTVATVDVEAPVHCVVEGADAAARAIETLFESPIAWQAASRRCRDYFERVHSPAEVFGRYAALFAELAA